MFLIVVVTLFQVSLFFGWHQLDTSYHFDVSYLNFMELTWNKVIQINSILISAAPQKTKLIRNLPITQPQLNSNVYGTGI